LSIIRDNGVRRMEWIVKGLQRKAHDGSHIPRSVDETASLQ
jgi:hypothetical protein